MLFTRVSLKQMKQPAEILDRMPDAGPAQGQQTKVPKANRGSAAQAMIASTMQRTCSGSAQKMPDQQFAEMQSQAMIARPIVQRRANGVCAAMPMPRIETQGAPLPLTKLKQQPKLPKHMRFIPTRKPGRVNAFIAQTATDVKSKCCEVIHQPMNSAHILT